MNSSMSLAALMSQIMAELPSMSGPEMACTVILAQATLGASRRRAWLTYTDFQQRTMFTAPATIAKGLKAVAARGFFRRCPGEGSNWELGEKAASLAMLTADAPPASGAASLAMPPAKEPAPAQADPSLSAEVTSPAGADTSRSRESPSFFEGDTSLFAEDTSLTREGPSFFEEDTSLFEGDTSFSEENTSLLADIAAVTAAEGSKNDPAKGPKSSGTEPLPLYKQRTNSGDDREWGRKIARARESPPVRDFLGKEAEGIPKARTKAQAALAAHPAAKAWLQAGMAWPGWEQMKMISARIGQEPRLENLRQAWEMWLMAGYRPGNIGGILDWYEALGRDPAWRPFARTGGYVGPAAEPQARAANGPPRDPTMEMLRRKYEEATNGKRIDFAAMFGSVESGLSAGDLWRGVAGRLPAGAG